MPAMSSLDSGASARRAEVVIAGEQHHLRRRMSSQPRQEREPGFARRSTLSPGTEVEVIAGGHELHLGAEKPVVAQELVLVQDLEELLETGLGIAHRGASSGAHPCS